MTPIKYFRKLIYRIILPNSEEFQEACKNVAGGNKILIKISDNHSLEDFKFSPFVKMEAKEVVINESFLSALWCGCYITVSIFEAVINYLKDKEGSTSCDVNRICKDCHSYAKELTLGPAEWPSDLPKPDDKDTDENGKIIEVTNLVFMGALNYVVCHEIAHLYCKHQNKGRENEIEADMLAIKWISKNNDPNDSLRLSYFAGFAFMILIDKDANIDGESHPSSFSRLISYLTKINVEKNDPLWGVACIIYGFWIKSFHPIEDIDNNYDFDKSNLKDQFLSLCKNQINNLY